MRITSGMAAQERRTTGARRSVLPALLLGLASLVLLALLAGCGQRELAGPTPTSLPRTTAAGSPAPPTAAIPVAPPTPSTSTPEVLSAERLRQHVAFLASDEMAGRLPTRPEYAQAADYAASAFESAGVLPGAREEQGRPSFFQDVPFIEYQLGVNNSIVLTTENHVETRTYGPDYVFINPGMGGQVAGDGRVVYAGYGIHEPGHGWDDLAGLNMEDAFVIFQTGIPDRAPGFDLPLDLVAEYAATDYDKVMVLIEQGAAAIAFIPPDDIPWDLVFQQLRWLPYYLQPSTQRYPPILALSPDFAGELFEGRTYNPLTGSGTYRSFELTGVSLQLSIDLRNKTFSSPNVVAVVGGSDPQLRDEYIVVSAHLDGLGVRAGQIYNGANDNATGCAVVLSVAESLAAHPPPRSVIFLLFTAEEAGHYGADYFVAFPPVPRAQIRANINLEVLGGVHPSVSGISALGQAGFFPYVQRASEAAGYHNVGFLEYREAMSDYRRSDQLSFFMQGIPAVEIGSGTYTEYHTTQDDTGLVDFEHLHRAAVFVEKLVQALARDDIDISLPQH